MSGAGPTHCGPALFYGFAAFHVDNGTMLEYLAAARQYRSSAVTYSAPSVSRATA